MTARRIFEKMLARVGPLLDAERARWRSEAQPNHVRAARCERFTAEQVAEFLSDPLVGLVRALIPDSKVQRAVLARDQLFDRWSSLHYSAMLRDLDSLSLDDRELHYLASDLATVEWKQSGDRPPYWPPEVAPVDVAMALERTKDPDAKRLAQALRDGLFYPTGDGRVGARPEAYPLDSNEPGMVMPELRPGLARWPILPCAVVVSVEKEVEAARHKPIIAVDASKAHHSLVSRMRDLPKGEAPHGFDTIDGHLELIAPDEDGKAIQLTLPLEGLHQAFIEALRQWRGWEGLRHWTGILRLLSVEGGRSGRVRWWLDEHINALGYGESARLDKNKRKQIARQVELLTKMELAVYAANGTLRERRPILVRTATYESPEGAAWALEGLELQVNPALYHGVRDESTGELGTNWFPVPIGLAKINHEKHPHALALGLILPMRWRYDWTNGRWQTGPSGTTLTGAKLLSAAGLAFNRARPGRTWETLRTSLERLVEIEALGRFEWLDKPWTLEGRCLLHAPAWAVDRTLHEIRPIEAPPAAIPGTGRELVTWRERRGLSQDRAAKSLGVGVATLRRAEGAPDKPLGRALTAAFKAATQGASSVPDGDAGRK